MYTLLDNWNNFRNAVVIQAAEDYRSALRCHNKYLIAEVEEFFNGNSFYLWTNLDGKALAERIRRTI